jgi:probable addiction module antidote protein
MAKKKTLIKQGFSFENIPVSTLKKTARVINHNSAERLRDKRFVAQALIECLQDGDAEAFKEILGAHLDVINKSKFSKKSKIPERTLYRMVSEDGNPTLDNIARVVHALCA